MKPEQFAAAQRGRPRDQARDTELVAAALDRVVGSLAFVRESRASGSTPGPYREGDVMARPAIISGAPAPRSDGAAPPRRRRPCVPA